MSYVTDTEFQNAPMSSGVICIDQIDRNANTVEMRVGYPDMPSILSATGTITDERTVTADCQMFKIIMTWNGDGTVTVEQYDTLEGTYTVLSKEHFTILAGREHKAIENIDINNCIL